MADVLNAECPRCRVSEFEVAQVTPNHGDVYLPLRCKRCGLEYVADLKPKLQWVDELTFSCPS